jgi:hypothetical protein
MTFVFMRVPLYVSHPAQSGPNAAHADRKTTRNRALSCKIYLRCRRLGTEFSAPLALGSARNENNARDLGLETKKKLKDKERHPGRHYRPGCGMPKNTDPSDYGAGAGAGAGSAGAGSAGAGAGSAGAGAAAGASGAGAGAGAF